MNEFKGKAYAKINPVLDVLYKRPDGYHEVRMVMQSLVLHDSLRMQIIDTPKVVLRSNYRSLPVNENNLVVRAIELMRTTYGLQKGVDAYLYKQIPVAAGLAGGSTDCACALRGMNELFALHLPERELLALGSQLGADVPFCLTGGTVLAEGIGERLTKISPAPFYHVVLIKPLYSVSTRYVYEHLNLQENPVTHPNVDAMLGAIKTNDREQFMGALGNILETVTLPLHPELGAVKEKLRAMGADGALMSGSGPTVFGLFTERATAKRAFIALREEVSRCRVLLTQFLNS